MNLFLPLQRNLTFSCAESNSFPVFFNSTSFLRLPGQSDSDFLSVSLSFRTWNPNGLLMFTALADGWVEVGMMEGKIVVFINVTKKDTRIDISSGEIGPVGPRRPTSVGAFRSLTPSRVVCRRAQVPV